MAAMDHAARQRKAETFRQLHDRRQLLLLPNAWDGASARLFAGLGFAAIATTSGGVAWSLGYPDGEVAPLDEVLQATARIVRAVDLPVTADIEAGYGATPEAVAANVRRFIELGVVGINLEDGLPDGSLRSADDAADRIAAARAAATGAGIALFINARIDTYLKSWGQDASARADETVRRGRAYLQAGADGLYPIGLGDAPTLQALIAALDAPVNVGALPGLPDLTELARIGVARVSTATRLATVALAAAGSAARAWRDSGRFDALQASLTHPDVQRLFKAG
jgi:2-methylisocitrate lyase-like PEP mutase family enzyme